MYTSCFTLLILFLFLRDVVPQKQQGDPCKTPSGDSGTCKNVTKCPSAVDEIKTGKYPGICGFLGSQPIVCCSSSTTDITASTENTVIQRLPGEISKRKCEEYSRYSYFKNGVLSLTSEPTNAHILECPFHRESLIIAGNRAYKYEFPHMVSLGYQGQNEEEIHWECSGTLISERYVITAGHCLMRSNLGPVRYAKLGEIRKQHKEIEISERISHPLFQNDSYHNIGLLKLASNVEITPFIKPACLYTANNVTNHLAVATGFGQIKDDTLVVGKDLLRVVLKLSDNKKCNESYQSVIEMPGSTLKNGVLEDMMLCGDCENRHGDIETDSGGPLQIYHEDTKYVNCMYDIVGITSYGQGCGSKIHRPGLFTKVSHYIKWIEDIVWPV